MSNKLKFKLAITRVKLNPEQAVLTCCYLKTPTSTWWYQCVSFSSGEWYGGNCDASSKACGQVTSTSANSS